MLRLRYIIASLVLLASGIYLTSNISNAFQAGEPSSKDDTSVKDDKSVENTFFTLEKPISTWYLKQLAELTASEALGQNVKVVVE